MTDETLTLDERIQAAEVARAELKEHQAAEALAAELPALLAEKQRIEAEAAARARIESAKQQAASILADSAEQCAEWRARWEAWLAQYAGLIDELKGIERGIVAVGFQLRGIFAEGRYNALSDQGLPPELDDNGFVAAWSEIGGDNPALEVLGKADQRTAWLIQELQRRERLLLYHPGGARMFDRGYSAGPPGELPSGPAPAVPLAGPRPARKPLPSTIQAGGGRV